MQAAPLSDAAKTNCAYLARSKFKWVLVHRDDANNGITYWRHSSYSNRVLNYCDSIFFARSITSGGESKISLTNDSRSSPVVTSTSIRLFFRFRQRLRIVHGLEKGLSQYFHSFRWSPRRCHDRTAKISRRQ
jgi:hypothetical protein